MKEPMQNGRRGHAPLLQGLIWTALLLALTALAAQALAVAGGDSAVPGRPSSGRPAQEALQQPQILCCDYFTCFLSTCSSGGNAMAGTCAGEGWILNCCDGTCYSGCSGACEGNGTCGGSTSCFCYNSCERKFQEWIYDCSC